MEQDTHKTGKSETELRTKEGNPNGNQGVGLQRHREGLGPPKHTAGDQVRVSGCGFFMENLSASPGGVGRKSKPNERTPSDSFQVQTSKYFTLPSLEKRVTEEIKVCPKGRHHVLPRGGKKGGRWGLSAGVGEQQEARVPREEAPWPVTSPRDANASCQCGHQSDDKVFICACLPSRS